MKACLFDMGNVLVMIDNARKERRVGEVLGLSPEAARNLLEGDQLQWSYECGRISTDDFTARLREHAKKPCSDAELVSAFCDMFQPNVPMLPLIARLHAVGQRIVAVSNTNAGHLGFVRAHFNLFQHFHAFVFSHEIKAMKPMPEFYAAAHSAAACNPAEALFIDDLPANIEGARLAGFATHLYEPTPSGHEALVKRLVGLTAIL